MIPKVFIIVLNWENWQDTVECLLSLRKITYPNYELLIVDNGSKNSSEKELRQRFPEISIIQTEKNLGYAGGNNAGIRYALKKGCDYILLLNNDTVVDPEFVSELVNAAHLNDRIGMLSSKIYFYDRKDIIWFAGATFSTKTGRTIHAGFNEKDIGQFDLVSEIERPCGCAMMVSKLFCEEVGLMKEDFFCYCEEVDWALRGINKCFKIIFVPGSKVYHKVSASTGGTKSGEYLYYCVRNTLRCLNENRPVRLPILRELIIIAVYFLSIFTMKISKIFGAKNILLGAKDFYSGRFGKK